jgi:hypothetical protein
MFTDNGNDPPDHLTELSAESTLIAGKGYWLLARDTLRFSQTVSMPPLDAFGNYTVDVDTGWNILGNPFDVALDRDHLRAANSDSMLVFHSYEGGISFEDTVILLQPFSGYYFYNELRHDSLLLTYTFPAQTPSRLPPSDPVWALRIVLESNDVVDSSCYLGVSPAAQVSRDPMDIRKPPMIFDAPRVSFIHPEWENSHDVFKSDIRPLFEEGTSWLLEISDQLKSPGDLRVSGVDGVPGLFEILLVNLADSSSIDVRSHPVYHYVPSSAKSQFKLIVGTESYLANARTDLLPREFRLEQNFPNPFNPLTTIRVAVPRNAHVTIEVLSILGQRVATLLDEQLHAGIHSLIWNGSNDHANRVASGVYIYRMLVDGKTTHSKKMILLK